MTNTPEIQARIERLNREHPPAKGMEWRVVEGGTALRGDYCCTGLVCHETMFPGASFVGADIGSYFRQVPAEAKEEEPIIPEELYDGHAVFSAMDEKGKKRNGPENVSDVLDAAVRLIKQRIKEQPAPAPAPAPGLDYERLFEVLPEEWKCYAMDQVGVVYAYVGKPERKTYFWEGPSCSLVANQFVLRNLPSDWTQSLRVREPKPEPDVEPDESTPWGTEVEVRHDKAAWMEAIYLGRSNGFAWAAAKGDLMPRAWVRCRLRREGK